MNPEHIQAALEALESGDTDSALEILKSIIVAAGSDPDDPGSADDGDEPGAEDDGAPGVAQAPKAKRLLHALRTGGLNAAMRALGFDPQGKPLPGRVEARRAEVNGEPMRRALAATPARPVLTAQELRICKETGITAEMFLATRRALNGQAQR